MNEQEHQREAIVRAHRLTKRFGERTALRQLSLSIGKGQIYGFIGPNGAGKSTLIRILCGLLRPDEGEVRLIGWRVPNIRVQAQLGYMPQDIALYPDLTVLQNLAFFGQLYDLPHDQLQERAEELLSWVRLEDRLRERVGALSGGMQRLVSLAVSVLHKPRVLLLDEPTAGVDPRLRGALWEYFEEMAREDVTLLVTTHLMEEALRCHRVGLLIEGRLLDEGAPEDLLGTARSLEEAFEAAQAEGSP